MNDRVYQNIKLIDISDKQIYFDESTCPDNNFIRSQTVFCQQV